MGTVQEKEGQTQSYLAILKRFIKLNRNIMPMFLVAVGLIISSQGLNALINYFIGQLLDYISGDKMMAFGKGILFLCMLEVIKLTVEYQVNFKVNYVSETCINNMRVHTYKHITKASMRWLDENKLGDIISRINGDLNALIEAINIFLTWEVSSLLAFVVSVIACFIINFKLALISFCIIPIIAYLQFLTGKPVAKLGMVRSTAEGQANAVFMDLIGGLTISKAFGAEKEIYGKYKKEVECSVKANIKSFALEFLMLPLQMVMNFGPNVIVIALGSYYVLKGEMTLGLMLTFILIASTAIDAIGSLAWQVRDIYNTVGIANRIFDIWDVETENEGGNITSMKSETPVIFKKVKFGYYEDHQILQGVDFQVDKGEQVALVGASGSGKSTILKLLAGFYEKSSGEINIFGNPIEEWNTEALRSHVSYVGQDSFLFPGSILSNVKLGREGASDDEAMQVIETVGLSNLDVNTPIGERGSLLSGGQRQRICIARALLKNADLILLDEPTSALDTESEYQVNEALEKLTQDRTCIMIAHRLSAIRNVDRIICLDNGKIVEEGTHEALMALNGTYKRLYEKQGKEV